MAAVSLRVRVLSLSNAVGPWVRRPAETVGNREQHLRPRRSEIRRAAPTPASIERDCERTLDDKFSPRGAEERELIDAREKISLSV